jgi:N-acetylneuraminate synthase/sialic acid synthase
MAREYIRIFSMAGADAIKFQTRDNKYLFSESAYYKPYDSENAFASIYGEHREILELKIEDLHILREDCKKYGVKFMSTPVDEPSLNVLLNLDVDIIKIASFDLGNLPFINSIAKANKPTVISIGGGKHKQIDSSIQILRKNLKDEQIALLHCVSEYPCTYDILGLNNIERLITKYPNITIGLSDHYNGILSGPLGYVKGARVFEKHVTLNRTLKGTDHNFALEPEGFRKFVRDIRRTPAMFPVKSEELIGNEPVFKKLGKSLIAKYDIEKNESFTLENLSGKIFDVQYIPVRQSNEIIGKKSNTKINAGMPIPIEYLSI